MKALNEQNTAIYYMTNKLMILLHFIKVMPVFNQYCIRRNVERAVASVNGKSPLEFFRSNVLLQEARARRLLRHSRLQRTIGRETALHGPYTSLRRARMGVHVLLQEARARRLSRH
jgi:hypothetical protein